MDIADKRPVHTVPTKGGWGNRREGSQRVAKVSPTKVEAQAAGRNTAKASGTEHAVHRLDGTIGEKNSYGNDQHPPKG